jgi:hypothetical protein
MAANRFEQVDEPQPDAITLRLLGARMARRSGMVAARPT